MLYYFKCAQAMIHKPLFSGKEAPKCKGPRTLKPKP